ncbi:MAG: type VI secretion system baseplate subunit TssF [Ignavibacterium sp.]|jgi:type VI secretion system protein ImpG|nr:type VI secretion system baseplate subunit TssF [Ignavibacterium sp.]MDX9712213.1 type VI secretion system baseplate subunit TssF [Ignavibacteriaceae bacterium]MEB2355478.1 type VI secretion system baseplate subunit TssF [Ignavibacteriales bacterium]GIK22272.1 MAG: type VI secretion system protein ImpG [Ignavibacteriota bacterium]
MGIEKYFEREYNFLQTAGEEFAKKHPTLGSRLRMSERERKDPFVERLFEGFAFLAGRIQERLDDEFPEIAGGILEILFPNLLKPFPSCSILQLKHKPGAISKPIVVEKGSEIQTASAKYKVRYKVYAGVSDKSRLTEKEEPADFIFRTTQDVILRPMTLSDVTVEDSTKGNTILKLKIQPDRNVDYESLQMNNFQLYLQGAASIKFELLYFLTNFVSSVSVKELSDTKAAYTEIKDFKIEIPDLYSEDYSARDNSILPYSKQTFSGYKLLQEYFSFPEKFFFIQINGLEQFKSSEQSGLFEIKIDFNRRIVKEKWATLKNIALHCTPIVNLFSRMTEEVIVNQRLPEYYIVPDIDRRKSREIYSVDKVSGISESKIEQYKYIPISSHDILDTSDPDYNYKRFFSVFRRTQVSDMSETFIRLFGPSMEEDDFPKETLSIQATLSNGFLPASYLEVGVIKEPINFPVGIEASNITIPTDVLEGPDKSNYLWSLIANLSVSYTSLSEVETLKNILNLYNWFKVHNHPNKKRIDGILKIDKPKIISKIKNRSIIRGIEFHITIDPNEFEHGAGDIYLFGLILNKFLSQYVTVNSFIQLRITESGTNKEYLWEPIIGKILPL